MICQDSWVYVTELQIKCLSKKGDNGAIMKSQSEPELSQLRASRLSPFFPFSASSVWQLPSLRLAVPTGWNQGHRELQA